MTAQIEYDWIVVGGGLCGSALAYELMRQLRGQQARILLIDPDFHNPGATRYSYGGIAYWAGTTELTRQLCRSAIARYSQLSHELEFDIEFQEKSLLLTIEAGADGKAIAADYQKFMTQPEQLTVAQACEQEPLLNPKALAGALRLPHGHVSPMALVKGYRRAFERWGGQVMTGTVTQILSAAGGECKVAAGVRVVGETSMGNGGAQSKRTVQGEHMIRGKHIALCAGAWSRKLLSQQEVSLPLYFTQAEMLETPPLDLKFQAIVMPAVQTRFSLETQAQSLTNSSDTPSPPPPALDAGLVQFADGHCRFGQISRLEPALSPPSRTAAAQPESSNSLATAPQQSEKALRQAVGHVIPAASSLPGQWHATQVSFCSDGLPLCGCAPNWENLFLFSGFSSPFVYVPPLAQDFAQMFAQRDELDTVPIPGAICPSRFE